MTEDHGDAAISAHDALVSSTEDKIGHDRTRSSITNPARFHTLLANIIPAPFRQLHVDLRFHKYNLGRVLGSCGSYLRVTMSGHMRYPRLLLALFGSFHGHTFT